MAGNFTDITNGAPAVPSTFNAPMQELSTALDSRYDELNGLLADKVSRVAPTFIDQDGADALVIDRVGITGRFLDKGGVSFNVRAFGATGDGTTDDSDAILACFAAAEAQGQDTRRTEILFPAGYYRISKPIATAMHRVRIVGRGKVRIEPIANGVGVYPDAVFDFTDYVEESEICGFTFYSFGHSTIGIRANADFYRQCRISGCFFEGGSGIQKTNGLNGWGVTVEKCRFNDCDTAVDWNLGGQTFSIRDCLFFNSTSWDLKVSNGSQFLAEGCVFESNGSAKAKSVYCTVTEATFIACQSERVGRDGAKTGADGDFDMQFYGDRTTLLGCRFWGGNMGSTAPFNSRNYGILVSGGTLEIKNSRIYSFTDTAIKSVNEGTILCDSTSWIDFRTTAERIVSTVDLGPNLIQAGACERTHVHGNYTLPFGWWAVNSTFGSSVISTTPADFLHEDTQAALQLNGGSGVRTNRFRVFKGDRLVLRLWLKDWKSGNYGAAFSIVTDGGSTIASSKGANGSTGDGYLVLTFDLSAISAASDFAYLKVDAGAWALGNQIEQIALYRMKVDVAAGTATYSANDSTYAGNMEAGPLLPYKPNTDYVYESSAAPTTGSWKVGDEYRTWAPVAGGYQGGRYTATGWKRYGLLEA